MTLPTPAAPKGSYVLCKRVGSMLYTGGHGRARLRCVAAHPDRERRAYAPPQRGTCLRSPTGRSFLARCPPLRSCHGTRIAHLPVHRGCFFSPSCAGGRRGGHSDGAGVAARVLMAGVNADLGVRVWHCVDVPQAAAKQVAINLLATLKGACSALCPLDCARRAHVTRRCCCGGGAAEAAGSLDKVQIVKLTAFVQVTPKTRAGRVPVPASACAI